MVERVCENALKRLCRQVVERHNPPLVRLKCDKTEIPTNPFKDFVNGEFGWFDTYLVGMSKPRAMCHDKCVAFFDKNAEKIFPVFIPAKVGAQLLTILSSDIRPPLNKRKYIVSFN